MTNIEVLFDFASPNSYLIHRTLPKMAADAGVTYSYTPCLLGGIFKLTNNQAPMIAYGNIKPKLDYQRLEFQRFITRHSLTDFTFNSGFPVSSLLLMRGAFAALAEDRLADYIEAGMRAMWEDNLLMSDPDVFAAALDQHGFDGQHYLAQTQDPAIKAQLAKNTDDAVARGAFGIPTFYIRDEMFFGKERLAQVLEAAGG